jgi:GNAT superfamily N-acetyltransferase
MRAQEFITPQLRENIENFPIANVRRPNGAIGNQGVNIEQAADVLTHAAGMQVSPDMSMRQLVDALRADPAAQQRLRQFVQTNPITVYALPDGTYHLQDGHHRTFLLNLLGDETVPAVVKEDVTEAKTVEFEGLTLKVIKQDHELTVDALDDWGNKVLGHVKFNIGDGRELDPQDLRVDDKYQGQGIARVMYDYVKSLGYTINRSWDQTDAGAGFWNKHRGEDVRVWESFLGEANASAVQFQTASTDNYQSSFTVTAIADGKTVGHFSFFRDPETDDVHNQAEVTDDVQGKGYGKALLLKAIEVANDHGLGFQEDSQSLSRAQSRVYDSLYDAGWIVDADGYWFLTPEGEQELARLSTIQQGVAEGENNDTAISLSKLGKFHPGADTLAEFVPERATAQYALHPDKWESTFYSLTNKDSDKLKYYGPKKISIPPGTLVGDMAIANKFYRAKTPEEQEQYAELYKASLKPYPVDVSEYRMPELLIPQQSMAENFHDGKNPGRKGLAKRSGVNTKASVSDLRKTAKNSSGEKQRMAHWLANMKAGRAKAKRK